MICAFRGTWAKAFFSGELQDQQGEKLDDIDGNTVGHCAQRLAKERTQERRSAQP